MSRGGQRRPPGSDRVGQGSIRCEALTFSYPGAVRAAVHAVDLEVSPGDIVAVVGPSGCGKSTLLRLVAGLLYPTTGRLLLDGEDAARRRPERRGVGWVPQSYALFDHLDVTGNVAFGLRARKVPADEAARRVAETLALCRIPELADRPVTALSGGQRQRVAIARALAPRPRVLLLDEPLGALDPQLRHLIRTDLSALLRSSGVTTLLVTHDQGEALAMADRVAVLRDGRVEQYDTPQHLWQQPASAFVAEFVTGATVHRARRHGTSAIELAPGLVLASGGVTLNGEAVEVVLRPGDLEQAEQGPTVEIMVCEYEGGTWLATGRTAAGAQVKLRVDRPLPAGAHVPVRVRPGATLAMVGR